jgi:hypothetical protein
MQSRAQQRGSADSFALLKILMVQVDGLPSPDRRETALLIPSPSRKTRNYTTAGL